MSRSKRLKKLVNVHEQLKSVHEAQRAGFLAEAASAEREAAEIAAHFDGPSSLSTLFPDIYHKRIGQAVERGRAGREKAAGQASNVALATARTNMVERAYREAREREERDAADRERLETIERRIRRSR